MAKAKRPNAKKPSPAKPAARKKPARAPTPKTSAPKPKPSPAAVPAAVTERDRLARLSRQRAEQKKEVGPPPDIEDPERRECCSKSLKLFCETYAPEAFSLGWSDAHLRAIDRIQEAATLGALFAFAMSRGSGKSTICRMGTLWATMNAICRYAFVIGATDAKATDTLDALKTLIRFSDDLAADYPEIGHYARALGGIANRASGQTCAGVSTMIEWSSDGIVFPTVPAPANWPKHWPLRADGNVPTSGVVIATSGLTGEGIRGSLKSLTTGEQIRPDLVILDDPQTAVSARSRTQNVTREQLVSADVLGMAGPGKKIAAVMPCTVIEPGDMADCLLDRKKHPLWRGERSGILKSMPSNMDAWDAYYDVYSECAQKEPPDFTASNGYFVEHRAELEAGAEASWPDRKLPDEISAIQHAMHLRFRDPFAFAAEYMNDPKPLHAIAASAIDPDQVAAKVTNLPRLVVPRSCTRLTAMIDVGVHVLWYAVVAWDERFGGSVIDYGPYPDQHRAYFAATEARPTLADVPGQMGRSQDATIYAGLGAVAARILDRTYKQEETNAEMRVERCLCDANDGPRTDLVYEFCRRDPHAATLLPSHGKFIGATSVPMANWQKREGETPGPGWRVSGAVAGRRRHVTFDTNKWKSFVADRLRTPPGAAGCLTLFHAPPIQHQMFADHCAAEYPVAAKRQSGGPQVDEWKDRVGRDNHLWDCLVGATVAVSVCGLRWDPGTASGAPAAEKKSKKRIDIEAMYRKAHPGEKW